MEHPEHNPGEPDFGKHADEAPHNPGEFRFSEEEEAVEPAEPQEGDTAES